ncbi:ribonuclease HIII [Spiroplasma tabanidicola]|uniref:Ribonuclease n=1 Tax=Spiroplasma tabanidicola TaxID=324079 RepID=A0A6I6C7E5_9MOLU|nr:ribonuclease HIII [Spiroplasma tabanidicola]QGS52130.1 ribonuclease HIII [Spiroplasma tabanidicola]
MKSISIKKVNQELINQIIKDNKTYEKKSNNPLIKFFCKTNNDETISIYTNNTVLIQANDAAFFLSKYDLKSNTSKKNEKQLDYNHINYNNLNTLGCDEVGVGDFFGPLVTCCAYIDKEFKYNNKEIYNKLKDSKKINNDQIFNIYNELRRKVKYSVFILENSKYNDLYSKYKNTHILKAICHNNALLDFYKKNKELKIETVLMDQFVSEKLYFNYLKNLDLEIVRAIEFKTKAEDISVAVACASIIARYYFLMNIEELEEKYQVDLPLGASNKVKEKVQLYKSEYKELAKNFIKLHFNEKIKKPI